MALILAGSWLAAEGRTPAWLGAQGQTRHHLTLTIVGWPRCQSLDSAAVAQLGERLRDNLQRAIKVRDEVVRELLVALLADGHVLIEDYPGVGKTALARALARSIDAEYARLQCTADLLPADLIGTNVFNQRDAGFEFHPGPIFANIVLVDEVNRASPKTQSGLLECMQERQVTVDNQVHELAAPFLVIATQNPVEYEGTYPLPEAQLDRFMMRLALGYPDSSDEASMLAEHAGGDRVLELESVTEVSTDPRGAVHRRPPCTAARRCAITWSPSAPPPERTPGSISGASPRAGLLLFRAAKAMAALDSRDHALPDDVKALAPAVLAHRLLLAPGVRRRRSPRGRQRRAGTGQRHLSEP